jgi:hypothetical protein
MTADDISRLITNGDTQLARQLYEIAELVIKGDGYYASNLYEKAAVEYENAYNKLRWLDILAINGSHRKEIYLKLVKAKYRTGKFITGNNYPRLEGAEESYYLSLAKYYEDRKQDCNKNCTDAITNIKNACKDIESSQAISWEQADRVMFMKGCIYFYYWSKGCDKKYLETSVNALEQASILNPHDRWIAHNLLVALTVAFKKDPKPSLKKKLKSAIEKADDISLVTDPVHYDHAILYAAVLERDFWDTGLILRIKRHLNKAKTLEPSSDITIILEKAFKAISREK